MKTRKSFNDDEWGRQICAVTPTPGNYVRLISCTFVWSRPPLNSIRTHGPRLNKRAILSTSRERHKLSIDRVVSHTLTTQVEIAMSYQLIKL